jgi:hypothetical protein
LFEGAQASTGGTAERPQGPRHLALKRAALAAATAFLAVNLWTGAPLLALWIGSQVVGETVLSMRAVFVVVIVLAVLVFTMAVALAWLNGAYDRLTGRASSRSRLRWLRSFNAEEEGRDEEELIGYRPSALELIIVVVVYVAVACFLLWFFLLAGSPLPH